MVGQIEARTSTGSEVRQEGEVAAIHQRPGARENQVARSTNLPGPDNKALNVLADGNAGSRNRESAESVVADRVDVADKDARCGSSFYAVHRINTTAVWPSHKAVEDRCTVVADARETSGGLRQGCDCQSDARGGSDIADRQCDSQTGSHGCSRAGNDALDRLTVGKRRR